MDNWLDRVKEEKKELDKKIKKLKRYMRVAPKTGISNHMLFLLSLQLTTMNYYSFLLGERIKAGEKESKLMETEVEGLYLNFEED